MSFAKVHLKAARDCLSKKDYPNAKKEAGLVLDFEPENYNAHVFLALALSETGENDESERIYRKATELNPTQPLAWQGICNLYERLENWDKQAEILLRLLKLFNKSQDAVKCAETLQKLVALYRKHGTPSQVISGISYYLPDSEFYPILSTLPPPDPTNPTKSTTNESQDAIYNGFHVLEEVVTLSEDLEDETFKREVERRRTRLGAPNLEQIKKEVFLENFNKSKLLPLYDSILNHPNTSDAQRKEVESKQLRYKQRYLYAIPSSDSNLKRRVCREVDELVEGIILLLKEDELGWYLFFEETDCEEISGYELSHVRSYIRLFPHTALATLFKAYFGYKQETLFEDEEEEKSFSLSPEEDPFDVMLSAFASLRSSILATRLLADLYFEESDYENSIKMSKKGLQLLGQRESDTGKNLSKTRTGIQVILASSLVHFFPPKHHKEAIKIVDEILSRSPKNTHALMDRAFILQAECNWKESSAVFDQVSSLLPDDTETGLRAREESAWSKCQLKDFEAGLVELQNVLETLQRFEGEQLNSDRARCLWRIGKCNLEMGGSNTQTAYKCFINALKQDSEFAPAFTYLGIYYLEHSSPPDPIRASKCFQKAFELDARETIAARRLAEGFANDREWDLVEVVAQRTIDGEGGLNAGLDKAELDASSRYLPTNSWAWKAVGMVKFHYKDYTAAIQAFQIALRVEPEDQPLWVRLGEAYNKAGRHVAALKALAHALEMDPKDWLCSYTIADVKQSMGLFEEAIDILERIRDLRPDEAGVLALLAQAYLDLGRTEISNGFQIRAEESFVAAINVALDMIARIPGFRTMAWKIIADSAFQLSSFFIFNDEEKLRKAMQSIPLINTQEMNQELVGIVPLPLFSSGVSLTRLRVTALAIHAYLSRISLFSLEATGNAGAWYDLSVALQAWARLASPSADITKAKEKIIEYLKKALSLDASNDIYWVALGDSYFLSHAKASQHSYIKALEIDAKNARTWINLGLLYFYHGDVELANEAFYRAQVLDSDNTLAWLGQFLIATASGDKLEAGLLIEHAVGLPTPVSEADYEFASQVFRSGKLYKEDKAQETLLSAFFILNRYCAARPNDASGLHLLALVCERLGHLHLGEDLLGKAITILEIAYEETEDSEVERQYTIANATLGRIKLARGLYEESVTLFESALGLLAEKEDAEVALKVQSHLGLGLAHFFQNNLDEALGALENALECAGENNVLRGHVTIILAQTLWALGTDEAKEIAKTRLLECIASDPENLTAINTLAGMGILTNDEGLIDAALSEILVLPPDQKHNLDPQRHVDYLLIQHHLAQGSIFLTNIFHGQGQSKALSIAQHSVIAEPGGLGPRNRLAALIIQRHHSVYPVKNDSEADNKNKASNKDSYAAALALLQAAGKQGAVSTGMGDGDANTDAARTGLSIQAVALASENGALEDENKVEGGHEEKEKERKMREALCKAQRTIMMRPSDTRGWLTLAYVRARM